ncbi:hypothetical protein ACTXIU_18240 [Glutamicibacter arilaitensis]|uniref:hypothetical protein n=1 Tax=Glutamicibacter arilaitensis TaxID=256701 RepID=UPI003FCEFA57
MGILQIQQVRNRLESVFFPLLDLHDISSHPESSLTNFKLTRALTAFVMMKRSQLSAEEAAQCITDGTGDNGLDGIALVPEENKIILVQSKWSETGKGSAELAEMIKFRDGVNDLLSLRWHKFNEKIRAREKEILDVLMQPDIKIDIVFAHMGTGALAGQVKDTMEEFVTDQNDSVSDALNFTYLAQTHIHRMLVEEQQAGEIDLTVSLSDWGSIEGPPPRPFMDTSEASTPLTG